MTPTGVRDGDPDALAGMCELRGPAVLAYCEVVAGRGADGAAAAADAMGSFRAGVVATGDLENLNPEAMLISATRHAAARYAGGGLPSPCSRVPSLLAARADRSITLADHDFLGEHLAGCWTCRAPVARFEAADRAYLDPRSTPLHPAIGAAMLAAMTAAAPVRGNTVETPAIPAAPEPEQYVATNGNGAHADEHAYAAGPAAYEPAAQQRHEPLHQPTSAFEMPAEDLAPTGAPPDDAASRRTRRAGREGRDRPRRAGGAVLGAFGLGSRRTTSAGSPAATPTPTPARPQRARRNVRIGGAAASAGAASGAADGTAGARPAAGTSLPRPRRDASSGTAGRGALRLAVVLPIVLVIFAIIAALAIAGVFGGGEPQSTPQSFAPSAAEPDTSTATAPVVVVPGAEDVRAREVEAAKARARAAKRRAAAARDEPAATTDTPPAAGATAPPAAATNAGTAAPPPPPPATKAKPTGKGSAGTPGVDADNGATGAEQVPAPDTSTVPELAPPVESLDPP